MAEDDDKGQQAADGKDVPGNKQKKTGWLAIDNKTDWSALATDLTKHREQIELAKKKLKELGTFEDSAAFDLAITDLITEKSVDHLSRRSTVYYRSAWLLLFFTGVSIGLALWWFYIHDIASFIKSIDASFTSAKIPRGSEYFTNSQVVTLFLVRSVTMGALFAVGPAVLGNLAISYFHEATAAYHQRHLIRFGRLWVELQLSGNDPKKPEWQHFKQAFAFDFQPATAFRRLRMPKHITGEFTELVKVLAAAIRNDGQTTSGDKHKD